MAAATVAPLSSVTVPSTRPLPSPDWPAVGLGINTAEIRPHASKAATRNPKMDRFGDCISMTPPDYKVLREVPVRRHTLFGAALYRCLLYLSRNAVHP